MPLPRKPWSPQHLRKIARSYDTSMGTTEIETDQGRAYLKPMGNRQGPHALACEWVATHLAQWFGLPTFDFNLLVLGDDEVFPLPRNNKAAAGPGFVTKALEGHPWSGDEDELDTVINKEDITLLVIFDTWTLNCDRHPPDRSMRRPNYDNVYLADVVNQPERSRLIAMDHTHCFTCGRDLTTRVAHIDHIQDTRPYGLFPQFDRFLQAEVAKTAANRLSQLAPATVEEIISTIPTAWEVEVEARRALQDLILRRAAYVADHAEELIPASRAPDGKVVEEEPDAGA